MCNYPIKAYLISQNPNIYTSPSVLSSMREAFFEKLLSLFFKAQLLDLLCVLKVLLIDNLTTLFSFLWFLFNFLVILRVFCLVDKKIISTRETCKILIMELCINLTFKQNKFILIFNVWCYNLRIKMSTFESLV